MLEGSEFQTEGGGAMTLKPWEAKVLCRPMELTTLLTGVEEV